MSRSMSVTKSLRAIPTLLVGAIGFVAASLLSPAASQASRGMPASYASVLLPSEDELPRASTPPPTDLARAEIESEETLLRLLHPSLYAAHFARRDGATERTGVGAYRYFRGDAGRGAIYYSPHSVRRHAVAIYGPVLRYFEQHGHEWWAGRYPLAAEQRAWGRCSTRGGQTQQLFSTVRSRSDRAGPVTIANQQFLTLCVANGRVWPVWAPLAEGAE